MFKGLFQPYLVLVYQSITRHDSLTSYHIDMLVGGLLCFFFQSTLAGAGTPQLPTTGFRLDSGQSVSIPTTVGWSGRIWARTGCQFDGFGMGKCQTGDCAGRLECDGMGATPPASLFEITLGAGDGKDFYDVSLVDGYNIPLVASPRGVSGECNATGCVSDINMGCPKELQVVDSGDLGSLEETSGGGGGVVACKSACGAFGLAEYCCSGEFANPTTCRPSFYSTIFKRACPTAYSYAFDDGTSTFTCKAFDYAIIFCPSFPGTGRSNGSTPAPPTLIQNQRSTDMVSTSINIRMPNLFMLTIPIFIALNLFF